MNKCKDCLHFKTKAIKVEELERTPFNHSSFLTKKIGYLGIHQIYYCKKGCLGHDVYTSEITANRANKENCPDWSSMDE